MSSSRNSMKCRMYRAMGELRRLRRTAMDRKSNRRFGLFLERCEERSLMTLPPTLVIPLLPELDQFGDQILVVQAFDIPERGALGIFDSGASAVTFSGQDQAFFEMSGVGTIPIKVPGGARAEGIGGEIIGDVSDPGVIISDGMASFNLSFDEDFFPVFDITLRESALETPGVQAFVGTEQSPLLPTITGTPALNPSPKYPNGSAAWVSMLGAELDFSDLLPGLEGFVIPFPDLEFTQPGQILVPDATYGEVHDTVVFPMIPFGADNSANPGDLITESLLWLIPNVFAVDNSASTSATNFLFDTGAQLSVISTDMALELGLDLDQPETSIDVQGVAGIMTVPGFTLDALNMQRDDGGFVSYTDVPVYVLDIAPGIDGIFGMNLMNVASQFIFDPKHPDGAQVAISYFSDPERGVPPDDELLEELAALFNLVGLNLLGGSLGGGVGIPGIGSTKFTPTTSLTTSPASVSYGQSWSITAALDFPVGSLPPTGSVVFATGGTTLATVPVNSQGSATWNFAGTPWAAGSYSITATYSGDDRYHPSSGSTGLTVAKAASSVTMNSDVTSASFGQPIVIQGNLSIANGQNAAGQTVKLKVDNSVVASTQTTANGAYQFTINQLAVGTHALVVNFEGTSNFQGSASEEKSVSISRVTGTLSISTPSTAVYGQTVPLVASVAPQFAAAYENSVVSFFGSGTLLGTAVMNSGVATLNYVARTLPRILSVSASVPESVGGHAITTLSPSVLRISKANVVINWSIVQNPDRTSSWTIFVNPAAPGSGTPTGVVRILTKERRPRIVVLPLVEGKVTYRFRGALNAPKSITYLGDNNFLSGSSIV